MSTPSALGATRRLVPDRKGSAGTLRSPTNWLPSSWSGSAARPATCTTPSITLGRKALPSRPWSLPSYGKPILVTVLGMVAEMERKLIRKRQQARIEAARRKAFIGVVSRRCYSPRSARCAMLVRDQPPSPKPSRSRAGAYLWACSSLLVCSRTWVSVWGVVISFVQSGVVIPEHNSVTHR